MLRSQIEEMLKSFNVCGHYVAGSKEDEGRFDLSNGYHINYSWRNGKVSLNLSAGDNTHEIEAVEPTKIQSILVSTIRLSFEGKIRKYT